MEFVLPSELNNNQNEITCFCEYLLLLSLISDFNFNLSYNQ